MQIVIDISEDDLDAIKFLKVKGWASRHELLILNGTPLEKHDEEVIKETVESIWGKPPYTELLDKIRTEIKSISPKTYPFLNSTDKYVKEDDVLQIIDKYKAKESEVEEC